MAHHRLLRHASANPFDIPANQEMLERIAADAAANGGELAPNAHWTLPPERTATLAAMLDPFIGVTGMQPVDADAIACYEPFLREIDKLDLCRRDLLAQAQDESWLKGDLGTLMDLNLIAGHLSRAEPGRLRIIEVGGGYGRVAEAFLRLRPGAVTYLMVDAVPATLMYAYLYMRSAFPRRRIGSYYAGDEFDLDFDCYVIPAWRTSSLPAESFDVAANIESMQEMDGRHVDYYLELFDRLVEPQGLIYVSNARDSVYKGDWHFPPRWQVLYQHNTPRSWSRIHPTLVMRKGTGDYSAPNAAAEEAFRRETESWHEGLSMLKP